jgi:hypothetical protein
MSLQESPRRISIGLGAGDRCLRGAPATFILQIDPQVWRGMMSSVS